MRKTRKPLLAALAVVGAIGLGLVLTGCMEEEGSQYSQVEEKASKSRAYIPQNNVELNNYNKAQELYDSPDSIIWCTTTWGNASAPLVTVPVVGKLTSSSVSYFPNQSVYKSTNGNVLTENRSVDGMYHGNPPGYRYGFTPGGQYVDFSGMPTFCTTSLTEFQRQSTTVSVSTDGTSGTLQRAAEEAIRNGDAEGAQAILEGVEK